MLNHENDKQRDLRHDMERLTTARNNTLSFAARKKPFVKTVGVEMGGGVNFFEQGLESRRYVIPNQDRYNRTHIHDIIREPEHPNQDRSGAAAVSARGDLALIHRKKRQPWNDDYTKRSLEDVDRPKKPTRYHMRNPI